MTLPTTMSHLDDLITRFPELTPCEQDILTVFQTLTKTFKSGRKVIICGNGGSAADAEHWAGELLKGFESVRPLSDDAKQKLPPELGEALQDAVPVIPLTGFTSLHSAFGNDVDPQYSSAQLVWALGSPGDCLIALSTSGNSKNVLWALQTAKAKGMTTIGLTGKTGGKVKTFCDTCICAPENRTFLIQELHLPIYHTLCLMIENELFGQ